MINDSLMSGWSLALNWAAYVYDPQVSNLVPGLWQTQSCFAGVLDGQEATSELAVRMRQASLRMLAPLLSEYNGKPAAEWIDRNLPDTITESMRQQSQRLRELIGPEPAFKIPLPIMSRAADALDKKTITAQEVVIGHLRLMKNEPIIESPLQRIQRSGFRIELVGNVGQMNPVLDNIDVFVVFPDNRRFSSTFYTPKGIGEILNKWKSTGEDTKGLYFWSRDMIIIPELTRDAIIRAIDELMTNKELESAFRGPLIDNDSV